MFLIIIKHKSVFVHIKTADWKTFAHVILTDNFLCDLTESTFYLHYQVLNAYVWIFISTVLEKVYIYTKAWEYNGIIHVAILYLHNIIKCSNTI